jgi:tripartite-type tricarboxylate transporter receptor subunit TctC
LAARQSRGRHIAAVERAKYSRPTPRHPGYEASAWYGIGAPKGTPVEIVDRLNTAMNESLADPKLKARLADLGATVLTGSSADLGKLIADETKKWAKVIEFAKIKAE